ncbi:Ser-Thr-rich glycosyl-phosphatidyl-inositol-anchored membrane family [Rhizoctonia solani]|uniref:Ser-Thr-rich glycosyl-phosphatidyl-inositol-anchored membrane family n=1 Tax=Rhizoctonia solani TaxID=456999 RepID=A0A8H7IFG6_9AGAM|nr:Ser-Thr-rich glycosyl-phosphatidyl-inositol-anchored membrane family [Rhizoctonia solani]
MLALGFALVAGAVVGVAAAPNPTEPSGASVFNVGQQCSIKWDADATGTWKDMSIQLMTVKGEYIDALIAIAQNIDATDATKNTYTYTCPDVTPNSQIYFYQFSSPSDPKNLLWTTRWTCERRNHTTKRNYSAQWDKIGWGKGALVDPSTAVPAPAYLAGNNQAGSTNSTAAGAPSTVVISSTASQTGTLSITSTINPGPGVSSTTVVNTTPAASTGRAATTGAPSAGASANNQTTTTSANGALTNTAVSGFTLVGAFVAALGLF